MAKKRGIGPAQTPPKFVKKPWCYKCGKDLVPAEQEVMERIFREEYPEGSEDLSAGLIFCKKICPDCFLKMGDELIEARKSARNRQVRKALDALFCESALGLARR